MAGSFPVDIYCVSRVCVYVPERLIVCQALSGVDKIAGEVIVRENAIGNAGYMRPWDFLLQYAFDLRERQRVSGKVAVHSSSIYVYCSVGNSAVGTGKFPGDAIVFRLLVGRPKLGVGKSRYKCLWNQGSIIPCGVSVRTGIVLDFIYPFFKVASDLLGCLNFACA